MLPGDLRPPHLRESPHDVMATRCQVEPCVTKTATAMVTATAHDPTKDGNHKPDIGTLGEAFQHGMYGVRRTKHELI